MQNIISFGKIKHLWFEFLFQQQHTLAELGRKQLEQAMQQLQEQLQVNLIQQTHLMQTTDKKKASAPLQQLALQQQQLIQQLQITQRQFLLQQGLGLQGPNPTSGLFTICLMFLNVILLFIGRFLKRRLVKNKIEQNCVRLDLIESQHNSSSELINLRSRIRVCSDPHETLSKTRPSSSASTDSIIWTVIEFELNVLLQNFIRKTIDFEN